LIRDSILYYEPRIDVARISVDESKESLGVLEISIEYTVRSTNSRFNMVFPFYLNEATQQALKGIKMGDFILIEGDKAIFYRLLELQRWWLGLVI